MFHHSWLNTVSLSIKSIKIWGCTASQSCSCREWMKSLRRIRRAQRLLHRGCQLFPFALFKPSLHLTVELFYSIWDRYRWISSNFRKQITKIPARSPLFRTPSQGDNELIARQAAMESTGKSSLSDRAFSFPKVGKGAD